MVIDPYRSRTAAEADWHIKPRPGTDGALAMIHVIINGNLVDRDYVENHTVGFDQLKERAAGFAPEYAERVPGVPAADSRLLAHEYATTRHVERLRPSKLSPEGLSPGSLREARTLGGNGEKQLGKQMSHASGPVIVLHQFAPRPSPLNGVAPR